jgi:hypothetical protein
MGRDEGFRHLQAIADGSLEADDHELRRRRDALGEDGVAVFLALAPERIQLLEAEADRLVDGLATVAVTGPDAVPPACAVGYIHRIDGSTLVGEGHNGDENARVSRSWTPRERLLVAAACRLAARRRDAECRHQLLHPSVL